MQQQHHKQGAKQPVLFPHSSLDNRDTHAALTQHLIYIYVINCCLYVQQIYIIGVHNARSLKTIINLNSIYRKISRELRNAHIRER